MMPIAGGDLRSAQLGLMRALAHDAITAPDTEDLLASAESESPPDEWERSNLAAMRRAWVHAAAVPGDLVEAHARATSRCELSWRAARRDDDFISLLPHLTEVILLTRRVGEAKAAKLGVSPYDALADEYEPGMRAASLTPLFARITSELPPIVDAILEAQARAPALPPLEGPFPVERQAALGRELAARMGFDFARGRLDVSAHPFCGGAAEDVRMTTRYDERDFLSSAFAVIHETGHALYELGLPRAWTRQPVGHVPGMGLHESQSLLMEMQAARTPELLGWLAELSTQHLGRPISRDVLVRHALHVKRSFIRVDADEATYPLHVAVRFDLERALLSSDLAVADLPLAFRDAMERVVGVRPSTDRDGCLQDVHWPTGTFGYFPTYTIGAIAASQLFAEASARDSTLRSALARGDFGPLRAFAAKHVHAHGARFTTDEILERATRQRLNVESLLRHLRQRYLS